MNFDDPRLDTAADEYPSFDDEPEETEDPDEWHDEYKDY